METTNLNATLDCIKETTTFTERIITNVCTGTVTHIPIGFWAFAGITALVIFVVLFFVMIFKMLTDF